MTARERAVLLAYVERGSAKEAAHHLGISERTVKAHLERVRLKLNATNTAHAAYLLGLSSA